MFTIGNNDLCPVDVYTLGDGEDDSKTNPINAEFFYTFEHPYEIPKSGDVYVPCNYSFIYGNTYFLSINSEITSVAQENLYNKSDVYSNLKTWATNDLTHIDSNIKWKVAFCHENPFTLITANLIMSYTSDNTKKRDGSHLNTVGNYWFSTWLENNGFKICIGGHKHTYTNSRLIKENTSNSMSPIVYDSTYVPATETTTATYPSWYSSLNAREQALVTLSNDAT
jgi:hypothetical protein